MLEASAGDPTIWVLSNDDALTNENTTLVLSMNREALPHSAQGFNRVASALGRTCDIGRLSKSPCLL